jgi:ribosomal protein L19
MSKVKRRNGGIKNSNRVGRPSTGVGQPTLVRLHRPMIADIDYWKRDSDISRPEAIRQLLEWALAEIDKRRNPDQGVKP